MKNLDFPLIPLKNRGDNNVFDLTKREERRAYFDLKVGDEIKELRKFMRKNKFMAYLLGKKQAGKGTYSKLFIEALGLEKDSDMLFKHLSVGDIIRDLDIIKEDRKAKSELIAYMKDNYRGFLSLDEILESFYNRDTKGLLPSEFILTLLKREIDRYQNISLFIDGFPRSFDQLNYALYFKELINYRDDNDLFILFDVAENIINERIKFRRICPKCHNSYNLKLNPTSKVGYDKSKDEFYLLCDNPSCNNARCVTKEGDELGIETIRERIDTDDKLIRMAFKLAGIDKILLRNSVPVDKAREYYDDYEITPAFSFVYDEKNDKVNGKKSEWIVEDDNGIASYSLMPATVVSIMIIQLHEILVKGLTT